MDLGFSFVEEIVADVEHKLGWTAFDDFYRAEYEGQMRRAYLLMGNGADAAEAVSDAFVSVLERWDRLFDPGPYLNVCVINSCRELARKNRRPDVERPILPAAPPPELGQEIEMAELLLTLPFRQRAAVVLRYYGGQTESEIAETLGCRPGSVGPTIHRALTKLKGALS